jgi:hypothetical protein
LAVGITAAQAAWRPWLAATLCLVVFVPGLWLSTQLLEQDDWRIATTYVLARAQPDDIVVFSPPWYVKPFEYYARGQIAYYAAEGEFDVQAVCGAAPVGHKRVWLIQPYESHWTDPNNRLNACLDSSLGRGEEFRFPPHNGRIVLYQVSASSPVIP